MKLHFYKYQGTGNDFIMIDNRRQGLEKVLRREDIAKLCSRRFGIGADGLILLSDSAVHDFTMIYYNSDGNESTMCGNGGRCLAAFARFCGVKGQSEAGRTKYTFDAIDGLHHAWVQDDYVRLQMISIQGYCQTVGGNTWMDTGSPHLIIWEEGDLWEAEVKSRGRSWRYHTEFEKHGGTNVNFVQILPDQALNVRTYERGVEDETYSCGTGVTAAAYALLMQNQKEGKVKIKTLGGNLEVEVRQIGSEQEEVYLSGPAKKVFAGSVEL